jgi:hypothetical protein
VRRGLIEHTSTPLQLPIAEITRAFRALALWLIGDVSHSDRNHPSPPGGPGHHHESLAQTLVNGALELGAPSLTIARPIPATRETAIPILSPSPSAPFDCVAPGRGPPSFRL